MGSSFGFMQDFRRDVSLPHFTIDFNFNWNIYQSKKIILGSHQVFLTTCESLIANKGGFLVCKHQINTLKLNELPEYIIVFATLNQLTSDVSEAMSILKQKYDGALPTNITNLSVKDETTDKRSLTQGRNAKNIYLLLKE